jgi:Ran GTPase-activating protein (RanGAP) involved in mRNA processing and transport
MKNCHLEDSSAEVIGDVLLKNNTLKHLNLSDNYITDPGARRLMEGMGHNTSLREILLKSNFVSYKLLSLINQKLT